MPRILHLYGHRPGLSGSGVFLRALVREAARRGYPQHALVAGPPETTPADAGLDPDEFTLISFPSERAPFPVPAITDVMPYPSTVYSEMTELQVEQYTAVVRRSLLDVCDRFRPDVVHAHHLWLMTSLAATALPDVPVVASGHHSELRQVVRAPHLAPLVARGIRRLEHIGVLTPQAVVETVAAFGVDPARVSVVGAGYDDELFRPPSVELPELRGLLERRHGVSLPSPPIVAYVGHLSTAKGVPSLIRACALARREHAPGLTLVLVGATRSGEDGDRIQALVREHPEAVLHVGSQPQEAVALILQSSDLLALPSLFEGLGLTTLEGAACGCRVLVSDLPTIRSFVADEWLRSGDFVLHPPPATEDVDVPVPAGEAAYVESLGETIASLVEQPPDRAARERRAARMAAHSWKHVFDRYDAIYRRALVLA